MSSPFNGSWFINICELLGRRTPKVFVETGVYRGEDLASVASLFDLCFGIEIDYELAEAATDRFSNLENVHVINQSSERALPYLVNAYKDVPVLFFLDAHWSGGKSNFGLEEDGGCPLLRELRIVAKRNQPDVIVIDDMRLMGKKSVSGIAGHCDYPIETFDFRHVTREAIDDAYDRKIVLKYECKDIDRLVFLPTLGF